MQTITTKYLPATNTKGSRIKATTARGKSIIIPYDYEVSTDIAHQKAVIAICDKLDWHGKLVEGESSNKGNVYVFINDWNTLEV